MPTNICVICDEQEPTKEKATKHNIPVCSEKCKKDAIKQLKEEK